MIEAPESGLAGAIADRDRRLVAQMADGDERALGLLYDRFAGVLYGLAYRIVGEGADAEEIVLTCFSQAWRDAGRFRAEKGSVIAWLTMICRSRAIDFVRSRTRQARATEAAALADPGRAPAMGSERTDPDTSMLEDERARRVAAALAALPTPQREAISLAYFEGLSHSEIAERLGAPLGTVKTRVRAAMEKLRDSLAPLFFEAMS
ncbi:MAG: RNA polymerase sigma factor [Gemmatimonadales bacterium]